MDFVNVLMEPTKLTDHVLSVLQELSTTLSIKYAKTVSMVVYLVITQHNVTCVSQIITLIYPLGIVLPLVVPIKHWSMEDVTVLEAHTESMGFVQNVHPLNFINLNLKLAFLAFRTV